MASMDYKNFSSTITVHVFVLTTLFISVAVPFPKGAPQYSCRNMIPGHSNGTQSSPPPYRVQVSNTVLEPGERARVSVLSIGDFPFLGFICAASGLDDPSNTTVGTMTHSRGFQERDLIRPITCVASDPDTAMTHTSRRAKFRVEFDWIPPANAVPGEGFKMRCTVVQSFFRCWTGIQVDLSIGQGSTSSQRGASNLSINRNNDGIGNNSSINNSLINAPTFQHPSNTNDFRLSPSVNSDPTQLSNSPLPPSTQNQDLALTNLPDSDIIHSNGFVQPSDMSVFPNSPNQFPSSSIPTRNIVSSSQSPSQRNDIFQDPGPNEIRLPSQSIDLALLIDLINMGVISLQDGVISFNSIQSPTINTNTIGQDRSFSHARNPSPQIVFPRQNNLRTNENMQHAGHRNRATSQRGSNSRGLFQSSFARPLNRNFNRIRQPRIAEPFQTFNSV